MFIFSENLLQDPSGNPPPAILALVLAPWMPSDTPNSPCPPYSPAVGFLPFCHTDFSLKRLASPCPFVTRLLFQALNVSGRRSEAPSLA